MIACEYSGLVRSEFAKRGHDAISYDFLPTERDGKHFEQDVGALLDEHWDLIIAFPPCTHLCVSGARWFKEKHREQQEAIQFFMAFATNKCHRIAIENPIGIMSTIFRKPDQIIQPWQFGHGETKATCLWLKNLPLLVPTCKVHGREQKVWKMAPSPTRAKDRSLTYPGIAQAMALQWG